MSARNFCLIALFGLPALALLFHRAGIINDGLPSWQERDARFRAAWLGFLRQKARANPEAAAALEVYLRDPSIRIHLASRDEMRTGFRGKPGWQGILGVYDDRTRTIVIAQRPDRPFLDPSGRLPPASELRRQLEAAAPVFIHETAHLQTARALGFVPPDAFQYEVAAYAVEKRYLARELRLTPQQREIGLAKLDTTIVGQKRVFEADLLLDRPDSPEVRDARRIFREWGLWSDAENGKTMTEEQIQQAMLIVASPRELCRAVAQPGWFGGMGMVLEAHSRAGPVSAPDSKRLAAARAYFRKAYPEYAGCASGSPSALSSAGGGSRF